METKHTLEIIKKNILQNLKKRISWKYDIII